MANGKDTSSRFEAVMLAEDNWLDRWQNKCWMSYVKDNTTFSQLSIPGTHDSGARNISTLVKTQTLDISSQLNNGIRFLDIRARVTNNNELAINHDLFYANLMFPEVLQSCTEFLSQHPSETIYFKLKQEYSSVSNAEFISILLNYITQPDVVGFIHYRADSATPDNPALGETRGKIVLLRNFNGGPDDIGIQYPAMFDVQDNYDASAIDQKTADIENQLAKSDQNPDNGIIYINFLSAYKLFSSLQNYAAQFNLVAVSYITKNNIKHTGVVVADFPGDQLVNRIIDMNYHFAKAPEKIYDGTYVVLRSKLDTDNTVITWDKEASTAVSATYQKEDSQRWKMSYNAGQDAYTLLSEGDTTFCLSTDGEDVTVFENINAPEQMWIIRCTGTTNFYGPETVIKNLAYSTKILRVDETQHSIVLAENSTSQSNNIIVTLNTD